MKVPYHDGYGAEHAEHPANCTKCGAHLAGRCDSCGAEVEPSRASAADAVAWLVRFICDDYVDGLVLCEAIRNELSLEERAAKLHDFARAMIERSRNGVTRQAVYERECKISETIKAMKPVLLPKVGAMSRNKRHFKQPLVTGEQATLFDDRTA